MFAISTSWNSKKHNSARSIIEEIKNIGFDSIELDFRLREETVKDISGLAESMFIKVISLHNFCPMPGFIKRSEISPDYYSLSSIDEVERKKAVAQTKHTIDTACAFKAKAVIVHSGRIGIKDKTRKLAEMTKKGSGAASLFAQMRGERDEEFKKGYLEALLKSISELSNYALMCGIKIGLENRYYFREMPSLEEFEIIFERYGKESNIGYWHDTGHAQVFENLKISAHDDYLKKFSHRLIGVHLHDVKGLNEDHQAPLRGNFDFSKLKPYLRKDVLKVLEPHFPATAEEIKKGWAYLEKLYGD